MEKKLSAIQTTTSPTMTNGSSSNDNNNNNKGMTTQAGNGEGTEPPLSTTSTSSSKSIDTHAEFHDEADNGHHHCDSSSSSNGIQTIHKSHSETTANKTIQRKRKTNITFGSCFRCLLLDLPAMLIFGLYLVVLLVQHLHHDYYTPLMERASRSNDDLNEEYTYYRRDCTEYDLSTRNIQDLFVHDASTAVHQMMTHGAIVIPQVLQPETTQKLRAWVVQRNANVTDAEKYPVSQGRNRLSYGIDPTEHPHVAAAVSQIANHPMVKPLLQDILGDDDPASAEITAITSWPGSPPQAWHSDTKSDGNALKFARTYSHSYSLFLPLQDTTARMGTTEICPGTQYCANDMSEVCEETKMPLSDAGGKDGFFRAGDAALANQHVWHRGSAHRDYQAIERVLFIVSFLARPPHPHKTSHNRTVPLSSNDARQLSRGTYFHQKWNMWGHTLSDLAQPFERMSFPYSLLRCLSLWKPRDANWGYDLVTSALLRFSNRQLNDGDLEERFVPRLEQLGLPKFLQGDIIDDETSDQKILWQTFLEETIDKIVQFVRNVTVWVHATYGFIIVMTALLAYSSSTNHFSQPPDSRESVRVLSRSLWRLFVSHGSLCAVMLYIWHTIYHSPWSQTVQTGRMFMRPFPSLKPTRDSIQSMITMGPTTLPTRHDVLIGTRYNAPFLGMYDRWLEYHPGNALFQSLASQCTPFFFAFHKNKQDHHTNGLARQCIEYVEKTVLDTHEGRFLQQDFRTGDWRVMGEQEEDDDNFDARVEEIEEEIQMQVAASSSERLMILRRELDWLLADCRFGNFRDTAMARHGQVRLYHLKKDLFVWLAPSAPKANRPLIRLTSEDDELSDSPQEMLDLPPRSSASSLHSIAPVGLQFKDNRLTCYKTLKSDNRRRASFERGYVNVEKPDLREGALVWIWYPSDRLYWAATILSCDYETKTCDVSFDASATVSNISVTVIRKRYPVVEGDRIEGCYLPGLQDCYSGEILRVMPSGDVAIEFDDGDVEWRVRPWQYYTPPFVHAAVADDRY